jgi:taurine dioxygenase
MKFAPLGGALGACIDDVHLASLDAGRFERIHEALSEHLVLFFREQHLSPREERSFAARFGQLQCHPAYPVADGLPEVTVLHHEAGAPSKIDTWHTDMTFRPNPPLGSVLQAIVVPDRGGDTLFSSTQAAWEALSPPMQTLLEGGLHAVHDFRGFKESLAAPGGSERLASAVRDNPPVVHPVVRTHPVTGRKGLYVNRLFTTRIQELSGPESGALLNFLFHHAETPEFTVRFAWQPGSIAMWDNRATWHRPVNDHGTRTRTLHLVVIEGDWGALAGRIA